MRTELVRLMATSTPCTSAPLKPWRSTFTEYVPGASWEKVNCPCSVVCDDLVPAAPVKVTLAPATTAPVLSKTAPATLPLTADSCAHNVLLKLAIRNVNVRTHNNFFNILHSFAILRISANGVMCRLHA